MIRPELLPASTGQHTPRHLKQKRNVKIRLSEPQQRSTLKYSKFQTIYIYIYIGRQNTSTQSSLLSSEAFSLPLRPVGEGPANTREPHCIVSSGFKGLKRCDMHVFVYLFAYFFTSYNLSIYIYIYIMYA